MSIQLTMLNSMASRDYIEALDQFAKWGLEQVDLKDHIFGKSISELTEQEASEAAKALKERKLAAYCFSTELFYDDIEKGEEYFRTHHLAKVTGILRSAELMQPAMIRLLAAKSTQTHSYESSMEYIHEHAAWLIPMYREAIDQIHTAGFQVTIENECHNCILTNPEEIWSFFNELDRSGSVHFTYDVQNLWQMGTYPSLQVYESLKPLIGFLHLKGGQQDHKGEGVLEWKSTLEDASWPVTEIVNQAVQDQVSPVICINPSHGKLKDGYNYDNLAERDLLFVRSLISKATIESIQIAD